MALIPFLFLDASNAAVYMERWKPQMIAGKLMSVNGVDAYTRTRNHLRHPSCVGLLVDIRNMGFVVHKSKDDSYGIVSCLWPKGEPSVQGFRDLREWWDCMLDVDVDGTHLDDVLERELWELSAFDA